VSDAAGAPVYIDTHAHLDDRAFDGTRAELVARAAEAGVRRIVNIGYAPGRWQASIDLAAEFPEIAFTIGVHPGNAAECTDAALERLGDLGRSSGAVGIGEIGLDFHWQDNPPADVQESAFRGQLRLAVALGLPVVIHQRAAEADLLRVLGSEPALPPLVLHSFDGSERYASFARETGAMVGVGGLATKQASASLRTLLETIPVEQILLETDSPYLIPAGARGRANVPANIPVIASRVAHLWGMTAAELAAATTANACRAFGIAVATAGRPA